jgi:hypothetical protein
MSELAGLTRTQFDRQNHRIMIYGKGGIYGTKSKHRIISQPFLSLLQMEYA